MLFICYFAFLVSYAHFMSIMIWLYQYNSIYMYSVGHKKEPTYFVCSFVKNQGILMQFLVIDLVMNGTCDSMNFTYLT